MARIGPTELIIILVIIILLFGVGRISKISGELGQGIRSFREGLKGEDEVKPTEESKKNNPKTTTREPEAESTSTDKTETSDRSNS